MAMNKILLCDYVTLKAPENSALPSQKQMAFLIEY